jgi:flagellar biosynthetic protein FliR
MIEQYLVTQIFTFILIFTRIGAGIMVLPGFGESYVPQRIRLSFALIISLILTPFLEHIMPRVPVSGFAFFILITAEFLTGLFIGTICNILISVTHIAGMIFSFQSGLSSAVLYDVTQSSQGSLIGNFLGLMVIVLIFSTGMDTVMLRGVTESYTVFVPGQFPPLHDFVETATRLVSDTFIMSIQITTPFIIAGTLLFLGGGVISRLMPTVQVFFLITAPQLIINFIVLTGAFSAMLLWYMDFFREHLTHFTGYLH